MYRDTSRDTAMDTEKEAASFFTPRRRGIKEVRWSVVMNNAHICSGHPISNTPPPLLPHFLTLVLTLKTISTPSLLSHPISLHIKLWNSEWPIVACCCCDIFGYIKFFFIPDTQHTYIHVYVAAENQYGSRSIIGNLLFPSTFFLFNLTM